MSRTGEDTNSPDFPYENYVFRGCAPGRTRTFDLRIRNPLLYPAELRAQKLCNMSPLSLEKSRMNAEWLKARKLHGRFGLKIDQSLRRLSTRSQARDLLLLSAFLHVFDGITDGREST